MSVKKPIIEEGQMICPHDNQVLVEVGGNGKPASLECSCGYVWYLGAKITISAGNTLVPSRGKRLSPEKIQRIKDMLQEGAGSMEISLSLGVSDKLVGYYKAKLGLTVKTPRLTDEQKQEVVSLAKQKWTNKAISEETGMSVNSVFYIRNNARATGEL